MKISRLVIAILATLILSSFPSQAASSSSSVMQVSATIRPWFVFNAVQHCYSYTVTPVDLQRGYVDLAGSISLDIKTNVMREISVKFSSVNGEKVLFKESAGGEFSADYTLHPEHIAPGEVISRKIDSRIYLTRNATAGNYPLNIFMSPEI